MVRGRCKIRETKGNKVFIATGKFVFVERQSTRRIYRGTTRLIVSRAVPVEMQKNC